MQDSLENNLERFSNAFTPVMHFFHNIATEVSKVADFSLAQFRVLMTIHHLGALSVNDLKKRLNIAQSTASEMLERLVQQELLIREKDTKDKRITRFKLTEKAEKIINNQKGSIKRSYGKILEPLSAEEQNTFVEAFESIWMIVKKLDSKEVKRKSL